MIHEPRSLEGAAVWDLVLRLGGQLRVAGTRIIGLDLQATFVLAEALGVNKTALAEFFPRIESAIVRRVNEKIDAGSESGRVIGGGEDG